MIRGMSVDGGASPGQQEPATRGFLFADLRGYTDYVERHGDDAGAALLDRYRRMVREVVARQSGAEVRTEGDSFYVLFPSASRAVQAALDIVAAAADETAARPDAPIRVGVGVHAGETAETAEGPVGSAVNVAARICAQAKAGEVLVSDTVRGLTRTRQVGTFEPVGTRRLKGIGGADGVYRVVPPGTARATVIAPVQRSPWLYLAAAHRVAIALMPIYSCSPQRFSSTRRHQLVLCFGRHHARAIYLTPRPGVHHRYQRPYKAHPQLLTVPIIADPLHRKVMESTVANRLGLGRGIVERLYGWTSGRCPPTRDLHILDPSGSGTSPVRATMNHRVE